MASRASSVMRGDRQRLHRIDRLCRRGGYLVEAMTSVILSLSKDQLPVNFRNFGRVTDENGILKMKKQTPIFEVEKLRVERDAVILHEVNWRVERGRHWTILGANGSGKTSLLSALTGYLMPSSGEIRIGPAQLRRGRLARGAAARWAWSVPASGTRSEPERPAREVIISGREAQINFWRPRAGGGRERQAARVLRRGAGRHLAHASVALSFPGRTAAGADRARVDGAAAVCSFSTSRARGSTLSRGKIFFSWACSRSAVMRRRSSWSRTVEEIVPLFSHVLLLRDGKTFASGAREKVLTSARLSATFGAPVVLRRSGARYRLDIGRHAGSFAS